MSKLLFPFKYAFKLSFKKSILVVPRRNFFLGNKDEIKSKAEKILRNSIADLSAELNSNIITTPPSVLMNLSEADLSMLSLENLEELGRAYSEGVHLKKDYEKAVEIWRLASAQGSLTAKFSYASLMRDGNGVDKNESLAFELFKELATKHDYAAGHVSIFINNMLSLQAKKLNITV
jgi:hypothetical protein